jgi:peptide/nickel transport system ATP-binding protein
MTLLGIRNLKVYFYSEDGVVQAVNDVDLDIGEGETLGIIGETGCGKTILGLSILRLLSENTKVEGRILYKGEDLLKLSEDEMRKIRGKEIAMIFQNPLSSGGMRQRAMIAMGLICMPSLIIADEPTTGLDVTIQAQIVELMKEVLKDSGTSMLLITHDLGVAAELCDYIAVMYPGEIVEYADVRNIFKNPKHPYTRGFLDSLPGRGLKPIPGISPSLINIPEGCKFHPRCSYATERCKKERPQMKKVGEKHFVRCFLYD